MTGAVAGNPLALAVRGPGQGADFSATQRHGMAYIVPLNEDARRWLQDNTAEPAAWMNGALVVEMRYFPDLADGAIADGMTFERESSIH